MTSIFDRLVASFRDAVRGSVFDRQRSDQNAVNEVNPPEVRANESHESNSGSSAVVDNDLLLGGPIRDRSDDNPFASSSTNDDQGQNPNEVPGFDNQNQLIESNMGDSGTVGDDHGRSGRANGREISNNDIAAGEAIGASHSIDDRVILRHRVLVPSDVHNRVTSINGSIHSVVPIGGGMSIRSDLMSSKRVGPPPPIFDQVTNNNQGESIGNDEDQTKSSSEDCNLGDGVSGQFADADEDYNTNDLIPREDMPDTDLGGDGGEEDRVPASSQFADADEDYNTNDLIPREDMPDTDLGGDGGEEDRSRSSTRFNGDADEDYTTNVSDTDLGGDGGEEDRSRASTRFNGEADIDHTTNVSDTDLGGDGGEEDRSRASTRFNGEADIDHTTNGRIAVDVSDTEAEIAEKSTAPLANEPEEEQDVEGREEEAAGEAELHVSHNTDQTDTNDDGIDSNESNLKKYDVVCKPGFGNHQLRTGNVFFQDLIEKNKTAYKNAYKDGSQADRTTLISEVRSSILEKNGRFVRYNKDAGQWVELTVKGVRKRVSNAFLKAIKNSHHNNRIDSSNDQVDSDEEIEARNDTTEAEIAEETAAPLANEPEEEQDVDGGEEEAAGELTRSRDQVSSRSNVSRNTDQADSNDDGIDSNEASQSHNESNLNKYDVVCNREGSHRLWTGNVFFRDLIEKNKTAYKNAYKDGSQADRTTLISEIRNSILEKNGRFVRYNKDAGQWVELTVKGVRKRVSNAFLRAIKNSHRSNRIDSSNDQVDSDEEIEAGTDSFSSPNDATPLAAPQEESPRRVSNELKKLADFNAVGNIEARMEVSEGRSLRPRIGKTHNKNGNGYSPTDHTTNNHTTNGHIEADVSDTDLGGDGGDGGEEDRSRAATRADANADTYHTTTTNGQPHGYKSGYFKCKYLFGEYIKRHSIYKDACMGNFVWPTSRPADMTVQELLLHATHILGIPATLETCEALDDAIGIEKHIPGTEAVEWAQNHMNLHVTSIETSFADVLRGTTQGELPTGEAISAALKLIHLKIGSDEIDTTKSLWFLVIPTATENRFGSPYILPCNHGYPHRLGSRFLGTRQFRDQDNRLRSILLTKLLCPDSRGSVCSFELSESYCITIGDKSEDSNKTADEESDEDGAESPDECAQGLSSPPEETEIIGNRTRPTRKRQPPKLFVPDADVTDRDLDWEKEDKLLNPDKYKDDNEDNEEDISDQGQANLDSDDDEDDDLVHDDSNSSSGSSEGPNEAQEVSTRKRNRKRKSPPESNQTSTTPKRARNSIANSRGTRKRKSPPESNQTSATSTGQRDLYQEDILRVTTTHERGQELLAINWKGVKSSPAKQEMRKEFFEEVWKELPDFVKARYQRPGMTKWEVFKSKKWLTDFTRALSTTKRHLSLKGTHRRRVHAEDILRVTDTYERGQELLAMNWKMIHKSPAKQERRKELFEAVWEVLPDYVKTMYKLIGMTEEEVFESERWVEDFRLAQRRARVLRNVAMTRGPRLHQEDILRVTNTHERGQELLAINWRGVKSSPAKQEMRKEFFEEVWKELPDFVKAIYQHPGMTKDQVFESERWLEDFRVALYGAKKSSPESKEPGLQSVQQMLDLATFKDSSVFDFNEEMILRSNPNTDDTNEFSATAKEKLREELDVPKGNCIYADDLLVNGYYLVHMTTENPIGKGWKSVEEYPDGVLTSIKYLRETHDVYRLVPGQEETYGERYVWMTPSLRCAFDHLRKKLSRDYNGNRKKKIPDGTVIYLAILTPGDPDFGKFEKPYGGLHPLSVISDTNPVIKPRGWFEAPYFHGKPLQFSQVDWQPEDPSA